jgi:NCAIR mutase (PurE)-related protein
MDNEALRSLLEMVQQGSLDLEGALSRLKKLPFENLGYARIDNHRCLRN